MAMHRRRPVAAAAALAILLLSGGCTSNSPKSSTSTSARASVAASRGAADTASSSIPDIVARVEPSVVTVYVSNGLGSGVVYRSDGVVVTNAHVVGQERAVRVAFADGSQTNGQVVGTDTLSDLAVVRTDRKSLPAATFRAQLPRPGQVVLAMGSPLGLENSVTQGIVSGVGRQLPATSGASYPMVDLLQTDAPISPGNSGGALVDTGGQVVGLNEAYLPPQSGAVSIGFAIPAATVTDGADQLLANGRIVHPYLGVAVDQLTPQIAQALGIRTSSGVLMRQVADGGPAAAAGIQVGDVMTSFNGTATPTVADFLTNLRKAKPGDRVRVELHRGGDVKTVEATLGTLGSR